MDSKHFSRWVVRRESGGMGAGQEDHEDQGKDSPLEGWYPSIG